MEIYPVYLMLLIFTILIIRILNGITSENKYQLRYLVYHFIFQIITVINMSLYLSFNLKTPLLIVTTSRVFVYIFFFLFLESIYKNEKSKV